MWVCTKCGRAFERTNQGHYCGKAPESVDGYIELQPLEARVQIIELRNIIQRCAPEATERIAWSMPIYKKDGISISFAACKKHISLYIDANILEIFRSQLSEVTIRKNAIYLPYDQALPLEIIENIVKQSFTAE